MTMPSLGELEQGAIAAHELLLSYIKAGFTRREALELVKAAIAAAQGTSDK